MHREQSGIMNGLLPKRSCMSTRRNFQRYVRQESVRVFPFVTQTDWKFHDSQKVVLVYCVSRNQTQFSRTKMAARFGTKRKLISTEGIHQIKCNRRPVLGMRRYFLNGDSKLLPISMAWGHTWNISLSQRMKWKERSWWSELTSFYLW